MKDFRLFDLMDFTMDEDFIRWVYDKKAVDETFWNDWLARNPEKHLVVAEAYRILESVRTKERIVSDADIQSEIENSQGYRYKSTDLSPVLVRLLRDKIIVREKNAEGQYEYKSR